MVTEVYDVLLFAGTTEGRKMAEMLEMHKDIRTCVFTATEYGGSLINSSEHLDVISNRLDAEAMESFFRHHTRAHAIVVDATHPYAAVVTENIRHACKKTGREYLRVLRHTDFSVLKNAPNAQIDDKAQIAEKVQNAEELKPDIDSIEKMTAAPEQDLVYVPDTAEAASYLAKTDGNVLLTTGSKELAVFCSVPDYQNRLFARVLSLPSVVASCDALGFRGRNLICMQGPFSEEMNIALLHQIHAKWLVTKLTGKEGGFPEKLEAARKAGCKVIVIGKPLHETGLSVEEAFAYIEKFFTN